MHLLLLRGHRWGDGDWHSSRLMFYLIFPFLKEKENTLGLQF